MPNATNGPKYPKIRVRLSGRDGNAFFILANVNQAMKRAGLTAEQIKEFDDEARSGDYDHLLRTCVKYVDVS